MRTLITGIFTCFCIVFATSQTVSKSIVLSAGNLSNVLTSTELSTVTNLTISGTLDARDFKTMRNSMPALTAINLSGAKINAYNGTDATGESTYPDYAENAVPQFAFYNPTTKASKTNLKTIILPTTTTSIGLSAFYGCAGLDSVSLPASVTSIKRSAFNSCANLQKINIPSGVIKLDDYCFAGCTKLTTLSMPSGLTTLGACVFLRSGISSIILPPNLSYIGDYAFQSCASLGSINIPPSVNYIGYCAFTWVNSLKSINVDSNNATFSSVDGVLFDKAQKNLIAFPNAKTANYRIPSGVTAIDTAAFEGSAIIENVYVPASVTRFALESFYNCTNLKTIEIPASLTKIEAYSFYNCYQMSSIYSKLTTPPVVTLADSIFNYINTASCKLYVPTGCKTNYQNATEWKKFSTVMEFLTYTVTVPAETKVCYLAGDMNGWTQQAMNKIDNTHYTINIPGATTAMQYKYCSGPGWAYVENTTNGNNRSYTASDVVSSWSLVYDPSLVPVDVTYTVTVPAGTYTCYFSGACTNWGINEMIKVDATHFKITVNTATPNAYKYLSGPDWKYEELDANGQTIDNRNYQTNDLVMQWREIYIPASAGTTYNVTVPAGTKACYIAGEMNSWTLQAMTKVDDTHYKLTIVGATIAQKYKYCSGPDWSYEELNADNSKVTDRTYAAADVVAKWTAIWSPEASVTQINNTLTVSDGTVTRYSFNSTNIGTRTVDVWLPAGYSTAKKYAVLYMHDGQMLFDATQTWNSQEWKVDETVSQLMQSSLIKDVIVVGIWNSSTNRYSEYYPKKSMDYLPSDVKSVLMNNMANDPKGDKYLGFITSELKPYIDKTYSVNTDAANTYVAGSSMGGLISWYALCEYPNVFGGAICMSTHWSDPTVDSPEIPNSFRKYLLATMPASTSHSIYFDHGTVGLDANYSANQLLADTIMKFKGYTAANFESLVFNGDGHNETDWANRFNVPLKFILAKSTQQTLQLSGSLDDQGFERGTTIPITWVSNLVNNIKIEYSENNGVSWNTIIASVPAASGAYNWTAPFVTYANYIVRVSDAANSSLASTSKIFTIGTVLKNIKFTVDMSILVSQNKFNPTTDKVFIKSSAPNIRLLQPMTAVGNNTYSMTVPLNANSLFNYKYLINTANADNGGLENNFPILSDGYRMIFVGTKDLQLATVFFNDGDMNLAKSSDHFNVIYTVQDQNLIDNFLQRMEVLHSIVAGALQVTPTIKTTMYLYKDLDQFHLAQGYPENPDWATGSAYGKSLLAMVSPAKIGLNEALGLCAHEYTHCMNAWKTKTTLPGWLNEGVACYYGRQFSTKDWIKSVMLQKGKPNIADIWTNDPSMGYAYSGILAYFIIKTKGETAMSKFIENMNYSDIGYADINALQTEWHTFLDVYLDYLTKVNVKLTVNMADMTASKYFNPATDKVFVKGDFNSWNGQQMTLESGSVYSITLPINTYTFNEYKFYTNSSTAPNNGLELNTAETVTGNRLLDVTNTAQTLNTVTFNSTALPAIQGVDMEKIYNKIEALRYHAKIWNNPAFSAFNYSFKLLSATEYQSQKPSDAFAFDAGFVATDGTINISEPTTAEQKAVFANTTQVALYYLCQSYMYFYYQTRNMPLLFKVGFPVYESGILPSDSAIKTAINAYGGSFTSFDVLNNRTTFVSNNGLAVAGAFAEFMSIFKNWGYPNITTMIASGFDVMQGWWNVDNLAGLLGDFNRYTYNRFMQPDESLRIKLYLETDHFKFYTRPVDGALNFPYFSDVTETAYNEYSTNFGVKHGEKLSYFTLPACIDGEVEGSGCNGQPPVRVTGGTAWSSGLHSTCAASADQLPLFYHMNRHELAHAFQGILPQGTVTAWLNEGFPDLCARGPITSEKLPEFRQSAIDCMTAAIKYFGHRPTYEETRIYPSPDYGYYTLGYFLLDYQYRKGGYPLVKAIQVNDLAAYQSLGYVSAQAFLEDFYFDFDVRVQQKPIATLISPVAGTDETNPTVNISWTPLKVGVKLNIAVSTDDAKTWTEITNRTTGTSCVWNSGNITAGFYVKISAPENMDVSTTYGPFVKTDLTKLNIISPVLNNFVISGDTSAVKWATTGIQNIKIEYTLNNGTNWTTITNSTATASGLFKWIIPSGISGSCKIRLTDFSNTSNSTTSETFSIVTPNEVGGPYLYDKNTLLLLHFDNDLNNRSNATPNAVGDVLNLTGEASTIANLGLSYKNNSALSVPYHANLSLTGDWTIEAWVKLTAYNANSNMYIFWKPGDTDAYQSNYSLEVNPWWGNVFYGYYFSGLNNRIGVTGNTPALNEWYHVAFTRDSKNKSIQVIVHDKNRQQISLTNETYTPEESYVNTKDLFIGTGFSGYIDEVRISNVVRSFVKTDIKQPKTHEIFEIYPNPSNGVINIIQKNFNPGIRIEIVSTSGQIVYYTRIGGITDCAIDLSFLPKGMYIVRAIDKNHI